MPTTRTATPSDEVVRNIVRWINHGLELLWLLALVGVPLAFVDRESFLSELELAYVDVPKVVLLRTLVGMMAILWLVEWSLQRLFPMGSHIYERIPRLQPAGWLRTFAGWLNGSTTRWVTLAVVIYLLSTLLSTALSESFRVSMWGLVPGQDTYPGYTIICYVVLFGIVAGHVKSKSQVNRLLWAIAFMGVLAGGYSVAQHYGYDIFTLLENPGTQRSGSTMGNAIVAGAVLLMTIPISLAAGTSAVDSSKDTPRGKWIAGLWALALAPQILGIMFTFSRGPWIGTAVALLGLLALGLLFSGWRQCLRGATVLGLASVVVALVLLVAANAINGDRPSTRSSFAGTQPAPAPLISSVASSITSIAQDAPIIVREVPIINRDVPILGTSRVGGVGGGGLSGRIGIWKTSGRLIVKRPWFEFDDPSLHVLRLFIGYGPDMFKYTYLLEKPPSRPGQTVASERFAHNLLVHQGVELGLLGILATLGLFATPMMVAGNRLLRRQHAGSPFYNLVMVGSLAALAGRFTEQLVGVAAVPDLTVFWMLLALIVALPAVDGMPATSPRQAQAFPQRRQVRQLSPTAVMMNSGARIVVPTIAVLCLIAGIGALTWTKSINYLEAGFAARDGLDRIRDSESQNALVSLNRAIDLAPDVSVYRTLRAAVYSGYRRQDDGSREPECARLSEAAPYDACLARKVYLSSREAAEQRPLAWLPRLDLAESALNLGLVESDIGMVSEAIRLYGEVAQLDPQSWWQWERLAMAHIQTGQPEAAIEPLEKTLTILDGTPRAAVSRLLVGMAYLQLGEPLTALEAFNESLRLDPNLADAYTNRGAAYNDLGRYQLAIQDLDEAIKLNPEMALAYNNRGNSYGNLDQLQRAVADYDAAVLLDPRFALAYYNRALAHAYIGKDLEAQRDVNKAQELGIDTGPLSQMIIDVRNRR